MIKTEITPTGRTHTWSDAGYKIRQLDTGIIYNDAIDSVPHEYEETDEPIIDTEDASVEDYENALGRFGV